MESDSSEMSGMTEAPLPSVVYLDTMSFIFAVEGEPLVAEPLKNLLEALRAHPGAVLAYKRTSASDLFAFNVCAAPYQTTFEKSAPI